jgi:hypothetical protein
MPKLIWQTRTPTLTRFKNPIFILTHHANNGKKETQTMNFQKFKASQTEKSKKQKRPKHKNNINTFHTPKNTRTIGRASNN